MVVYLATDAFDHLYRRVGCTAADIATLRKAIYGRALSIPLSLQTLEEIFLAPDVTARMRSAQMRMLLSISSPRRLLKPAEDLLMDDLRSFAASGQPESSIQRGEVQNAVSAGISSLLESDGVEMDEDFVEALQAARRQRESLGAALAELRGAGGPAAAHDGFDEYFRQCAPGVAEALAERAGVAARCRERGLDELLKIKSVRMWTGAALWFGWTQAVENRLPSSEEVSDAMHAVLAAAAAGTLVTDNERLLRLSAHAKVEGFEAIDLKALLAKAA
jgi:hypothetical protein